MNGQSNTSSDATTNTSYSASSSSSTTGGPVLSGSDTDTTKTAKQAAGQAANQVQDKVSQATQQVTQQTKAKLTDQISQASQALHGVANAINQAGDQLRKNDQTASYANIADKASDQVDRLANYLNGKNADQLINSAEDFARRDPVWFLAGAFALGLLGARFLKSTQSHPIRRDLRRYANQGNMSGQYMQGQNWQGQYNQGQNRQGQTTNRGMTMYQQNLPSYSTARTNYTDLANNEEDRLRNTTR